MCKNTNSSTINHSLFLAALFLSMPSFAQRFRLQGHNIPLTTEKLGTVSLESVFGDHKFSRPTAMVFLPKGSFEDLVYIAEQSGEIKVANLKTKKVEPSPFINLSSKIENSNGELGLLGLALSPDFN